MLNFSLQRLSNAARCVCVCVCNFSIGFQIPPHNVHKTHSPPQGSWPHLPGTSVDTGGKPPGAGLRDTKTCSLSNTPAPERDVAQDPHEHFDDTCLGLGESEICCFKSQS